ncbi:MAG: DUF1588 domain-containing protein [Myxococcota bacterium]
MPLRLLVFPGLLALAGACVPETLGPPTPTPGAQSASPPGDTLDQGIPTGPAPLRLLTRAEYAATVKALLRIEDADEGLPSENQVVGFDNFASANAATPTHVEAYQRAAVRIADHAVEDLVGLTGCEENADCGHAFIADFGRKAFRRSLDPEEEVLLRSVYDDLASSQGHRAGVVGVLQAVLQSPQFLYRVETGPEEADQNILALNGPALATRLAYLLWNETPDEALLDQAEGGALSASEGLSAQARSMLSDPRAREGMENFYAQLLETKNFDSMTKAPQLYPRFAPDVALELRASLHAYMDHVLLDPSGGWSTLFAGDQVWATPRLANIYELPTPTSGALGPVSGGVKRTGGLLTQPALLALLAKPDRSGPIARGVFVLERLLCQHLQSPPPGTPIVPPEPVFDRTTRERFEQHTEDAECASCHQYIDPVGFLFEHYDGMGAWRDSENGFPVDASGALTQTEDPTLRGALDGAASLAERLSSADEVGRCMATQWFRYAMGRFETRSDFETIDAMTQSLLATDRFEEMLVTLVTSTSFTTRFSGAEP